MRIVGKVREEDGNRARRMLSVLKLEARGDEI